VWASTRIVALADGALVVDEDSGTLVRTDAEGQRTAQLAIGKAAGLLAYDEQRHRAYVADRMGDRVLVVEVGSELRVAAQWKTPAEPFGVAVTPDGTKVAVSLIADRVLVVFDAHTGSELWRVPLSPEPRTVAISPDGRRALVASARMGAVDDIALDRARSPTTIAFDLACDGCASGEAFARGGGGIVFLDDRRAIVSFQRTVPEALGARVTGLYGGGSRPPVTQHLSFLSFDQTTTQVVAQIVANDPRAIAWDEKRDALYVAGRASSSVLRLAGLTRGTTDDIDRAAGSFVLSTRATCGPDGMALAGDGSVYIWCSLSRTVVHVREAGLVEGPEVATSTLTPRQHAGYVLFNSTDVRINMARALACTTCHIDGRTDGVSWRIGTATLQTPVLAGRLAGTAPYKWAGTDATLADSLHRTINRLGGTGLEPVETEALVAYLESMPRPRAPTLDAAAVERGKRVFDVRGGCVGCHRGPQLTDNERHLFDSAVFDADTPSLIGLAASAPYYHDGSAPTLEALVAGRGSVHGMADFTYLSEAERADLAVYLASL
jgi:DNA-binding beta-propeller fold protein YncE/mono/diheme cytochrome c family protein